MNEQERLEDLISYQILDTPAEEQLDEIVEIAATSFDVPVALISFLDDKRQWFKAKIGVESTEIPKNQSLCQYTIQSTTDLLVIENANEDDRTKDHPLVTNHPNFQFYAGAPLVSYKGNVIGTFCVMDVKPKELSEKQKRLIRILAKSTMNYINSRKIILAQRKNIDHGAEKLKQLTDNAPGIIFQFEATSDGRTSFPFISGGIFNIDEGIDTEGLKRDAAQLRKLVYKKDFPLLVNSIIESAQTMQDLNIEFRIRVNGKARWHLCMAKPEKTNDEMITWFGTLQDITNRVEYENTIEQISFDISHILRRPVTTLLGLSSVIEKDENLDEKKLKEYSGYIRSVSDELDNFTRKLNETYIQKKKLIKKIEG
ncbi:MAG: GAF domain-containing protein [Bacteroidota bacterium]